jgi:hypothetical protein
MSGEEGIRLGIACQTGQVVFLIDAPERCQRIVAMQLANAFPGGRSEVVNFDQADLNPNSRWLRMSPDVKPFNLSEDCFKRQASKMKRLRKIYD